MEQTALIESPQAFLTQAELATRLRVSTRVVRHWTHEGMPCVRLGPNLVRYSLPEVLTWHAAREENYKRLRQITAGLHPVR